MKSLELSREEALHILRVQNKLTVKPNFGEKDPYSRDVYVDFPNKFECPSLSATSERTQPETNTLPAVSPPIEDVVKALSGLPYNKSNHSLVDEKIPLLRSDTPQFKGAVNSFDNIVISKTDSVSSCSQKEGSSTEGDILSGPDREVVDVDPGPDKSQSLDRSSKRHNLLRLIIPKEISAISRIKQLSAAETRIMDKAIEVANSFSRMSTQDQSTPRTPGSSPKNSPHSIGENSPTGHTWFNSKKRIQREDKRAFVDGLNSSPNPLLTPEAQEAYNSLVARLSLEEEGDLALVKDATVLPVKAGRKLPLFVPYRNRSSLSESDRYPVCINGPYSRSAGSPESNLAAFRDGKLSRIEGKTNKQPSPMVLCERFETGVANVESVSVNGNFSGTFAKSSYNGIDSIRPSSILVHSTSSSITPTNTRSINIASSNSTSNQTSAYSGSRPYILQRSVSMFEKGSDISDDGSAGIKIDPSDIRPYVKAQIQTEIDASSPCAEKHSASSASTPCQTQPSLYPIDNNIPLPEVKIVNGDTSPPPPPIPPRIPLRQSTINSRPPQRKHPLPSDPVFPEKPRTVSEVTLPSIARTREHNENEGQTRYSALSAAELSRSYTNNSSFSPSSPSSSSCGSHQLNLSMESTDSVFSCEELSCIEENTALTQALDEELSSPANLCEIVERLSGSIRNVKLKASELGIHDKSDLFWLKHVKFDIPNCSQSETDTVRKLSPDHVQGMYDTSDGASYEDLMEFALEVEENRLKKEMANTLCEEVCLMRKVLSEDVTVDDCVNALDETSWDVHRAIKLIKLKQLLNTNLADKQQCKQALMFCRWDIQEAAAYLLVPPAERLTPDLADISL